MGSSQRPRVIIIGAGFGGLFAARQLARKPVEVVLIDRNNFHTFTPLLYQVATCVLDPSEIAFPIRGIFRNDPNVRFLLGEVVSIDTANATVRIQMAHDSRDLNYDYLILASGSSSEYFGNDTIRRHSFELKSLADAVVLRNHILEQFELATWEDEADRRAAHTTLVVVGGGPTGVETAGALYELYNHVLAREFGGGHQLQAKVVLVEAQPHLLNPYPARLREAALRQLRSLGVEVRLGSAASTLAPDRIELRDGASIQTETVIWTAGVRGSGLGQLLGAELTRRGTVPVDPTMSATGDARVYVVGDLAHLADPQGEPYPMFIPVAKQQGILAARNILRRIAGEAAEPFKYRDRGLMATIGRRRAVAWIYNRLPLTGYVAWLAWLGLHLVTLLGFRNKLNVLVNWTWNYFTYDRSVRIILGHEERRDQAPS